jgi:glycerol-3-phosphate dehydrogenase
MSQPIVILGGGINGSALARELLLNGLDVWLVDTADLAGGATAYSSRLIHGGLRYLEFGEFSLVRESLHERGRLLRLAPHLVRPLRLFIPVQNRWGGITAAAGKFLGVPLRAAKSAPRGMRVVQAGLWLYDRFAKEDDLPPRSLHQPTSPGVPQINRQLARWLWAYSDAQINYPERMVIDFLVDARRLATENGLDFRVFTYSRASLVGKTLEIRPARESDSETDAEPTGVCQPAAIVNATGAWVDSTLARLPVPSQRLMGGTKGSHFLTFAPRLTELLAGQGIYTEASDGRPVFVLPFLQGTLVGTTDIPFTGDPAAAVATEQELAYLLAAVNDVLPDAKLTRDDVALHCCGVRPLPFVDAQSTAAITRRHQLVWNDAAAVPIVSLVGGKLTTCRSLAEEAAAAIGQQLGREISANSRERAIPRTPVDDMLVTEPSCWESAARWAAEHEWVTSLEDLVERRLMLHFSPELSRRRLEELAELLVAAGSLRPADREPAIERCVRRLADHFGRLLP